MALKDFNSQQFINENFDENPLPSIYQPKGWEDQKIGNLDGIVWIRKTVNLSAEEAKNMGLIAEVFEDETFAENSMEILTRISNMPTKAISITKKAFNESYLN